MTAAQKASLRKLLTDLRATELHHGDCVGADAEAHAMALELRLRVIIHPPLDGTHQAYCQGAYEVLGALSHFARNRNIVRRTDMLIGASVADHRLERGGTWYTIDYAALSGSPYVIWPNGTVSLIVHPPQ